MLAVLYVGTIENNDQVAQLHHFRESALQLFHFY